MPTPLLMEDVLEVVLAHLPLTELLLSHSLVCRTWRDIIQRETFLPHRKSYYQYKLGRVTTRDRLDKLVKEQVELVVDLQGLTTIQQTRHEAQETRQLCWRDACPDCCLYFPVQT
jgi:hypothetical protein